jgi:hypothetical protein
MMILDFIANTQFIHMAIQGNQLYNLFWEAVERLERCGQYHTILGFEQLS